MSDPTTPEGRAELRRLLDNATPAPWEGVPGFGTTAIYGQDHEPGEFVAQRVPIPDAKLIIRLRNTVPALLDALDQAEAALEQARKTADRYASARAQWDRLPHISDDRAEGMNLAGEAVLRVLDGGS
jgi:hypothetical protein